MMTYNIQGHAAARRPDHLEKIAAVIANVSPDIVGLQEVHCRTRKLPIDQGERLAELTGLTLAFGRSCSMDGGEYGNAVLTRGSVTQSPCGRSGARCFADGHGRPDRFNCACA